MDANETKFHLLCGHADWAGAFLEDGATALDQVWEAFETDRPLPGPEELTHTAGWLVDRRTAPELSLRPRLVRFAPSAGNRPVTEGDRRGAGRDRYGNWYVVGPDRAEILVRSSGTDQVTTFWPPRDDAESAPPLVNPGEFAPADATPVSPSACHFTGLTITRDHHLVATSTVDGRTEILIFDLFAGGPPVRLQWPPEVRLEPWDLAPREPGGLWLLDRRNRRLWELNTHFRVVRPPWLSPALSVDEEFSGVCTEDASPPGPDAESPCCPVARVTAEHALPLEELDPIAVEQLPGGGALVLDGDASARRIGAYRDFVRRGQDSLDEILRVIELDDSNRDWRLIPHDFAVVTDPSPAMKLDSALHPPFLLVADRVGNQAFCFELAVSAVGEPHLTSTKKFLPMRLFGGNALLAADGGAYYDGFRRFVPLVAQERPRYELKAVVVTAPLDGDAPGCVWHRILFDGCIPSGTSVRISTRATDADGADLATPEGREAVHAALRRLSWDEEPTPVCRASGSEIPWLRAEAVGENDTWELLVQRSKGRYMQLLITLEGDARRTPRIRALRAYFPRFSYVSHYLPACYRDDGLSAAFLERWLANYEGIVTAIEDRALALGTLCDPSAAPAEFLDWLGRWYAVYLDPAWPPLRKRLFLQRALTFFQWRGTARGLRMALRLAFDDCISEAIFTEAGDKSRDARRYRIIEHFRRRLLPGATATLPPCPGVDVDRSAESGPWRAEDGLEKLHRRYRAALGSSTAEYSPVPPEQGEERNAWVSFSETALGFVPASGLADQAAWRSFLRCRYPSFAEARSAWGRAFAEEWDSFVDVEPPQILPSNTQALDDWLVFHRVVRPMRAAAHRFTVSLPVRPQRARDTEKLRAELHLADRLVALEKPAHGAYRVELYWALFRVGEVRLGADTELGQGSRLPELLPPFVLGEGALAEGRLAPRPEDWNRGRVQLGRNPLPRGATRKCSSHGDFQNP